MVNFHITIESIHKIKKYNRSEKAMTISVNTSNNIIINLYLWKRNLERVIPITLNLMMTSFIHIIIQDIVGLIDSFSLLIFLLQSKALEPNYLGRSRTTRSNVLMSEIRKRFHDKIVVMFYLKHSSEILRNTLLLEIS